MSDVREKLVKAISPMCRDQWWELNRPGEVTAREHAEVIVDRLLDALSAEQASPERVERAAKSMDLATNGESRAGNRAALEHWSRFARIAFAAAGPVVVVRDSEERLTARWRFEIYRDWRGEFRWRFVTDDGSVLADSRDGFPSEEAARLALQGIRPRLSEALRSEERLTEEERYVCELGHRFTIEVATEPSQFVVHCPVCGANKGIASVSPSPSSPPEQLAERIHRQLDFEQTKASGVLTDIVAGSPSSPAPSAEERERIAWELHQRALHAEEDLRRAECLAKGYYESLKQAERRVSELEQAAREVVKRAFQSAVFPTSMIVDRTLLDALRALLSDTEGGDE